MARYDLKMPVKKQREAHLRASQLLADLENKTPAEMSDYLDAYLTTPHEIREAVKVILLLLLTQPHQHG